MTWVESFNGKDRINGHENRGLYNNDWKFMPASAATTFPPMDVSSPKLAKPSRFAKLFCDELTLGTRPRGNARAVKTWAKNEFLAAIVAASGELKDSFHKPSDPTYRNWCSGTTSPHPREFNAIERVLFGDDPTLRDRKAALRKAWEAANKRQAKPARKRMAASADPPPGSGAAVGEAFTKLSQDLKYPLLVSMLIDAGGGPENHCAPENFQVTLDLSWGTDDGHDPDIEVSLRGMYLTLKPEDCVPVPHSFYTDGDDGIPGGVPGVKRAGHRWTYTVGDEPILLGKSPIQRLVRLQRADGSTRLPKVTVEATCPTEYLQPVSRDKTLKPDAMAVISRFLAKCLTKENAAVDLGSATMRWAEPEP